MRTTLCNKCQKSCSTNFFIFPITLPYLNVACFYKMFTNFRQYFFLEAGGGKKVGLASNLLEMNHKISVYYVD